MRIFFSIFDLENKKKNDKNYKMEKDSFWKNNLISFALIIEKKINRVWERVRNVVKWIARDNRVVSTKQYISIVINPRDE